MDWMTLKDDIAQQLKKYRCIIIIILAGIILMLMPSQDAEVGQIEQAEKEETVDFQSELEEILSQIAGAGNVKVLLAESSGRETIYQTDTHSGENDVRKDTVLITTADRNETGLVIQSNPPAYQGAVVLCQGADRADIRLFIVEAVKSATGLTSDCITVLKMK